MTLVKRPWGYEEIWAETSDYVGKYVYIDPNTATDVLLGKNDPEFIRVIEGRLALEIQSTPGIFSSRSLDIGESYRINPMTAIRMRAKENSVIIVSITKQTKEIQNG